MTIPYRTRQILKRVAIILLIATLVLGILFALWFFWLQRFVVYTKDGVVFDFSLNGTVTPGELLQKPDEQPTIPIHYGDEGKIEEDTELTQMIGYYVDAEALLDMAAVRSQIQQLPAGSAVMVDVKDIMGRFFYTTSLGTNLKGIDPTNMDRLIDEICSGGLYAIARFPAYREYLYAVDNVNHGLSSTKGQYLYWDPDRCYWLNPANSGAQTFIMQQLSEIKGMGFDEVVLADFRFPNTNEIRFSGNKTQTLIDAAANLMNTFGSDRFVLSFEVTDPKFVLPSGGRSRLYKIGCTAEEAKGVAEAAKDCGVTDTAVQLVFTTELLDTRFDPYGVLRPITSATIEEE